MNPDGSTSPSCWYPLFFYFSWPFNFYAGWHMNFRFSKEVIAPIAKRLSSAHPPKYSEILEMDRQIRDFDLSKAAGPQASFEEDNHSHCTFGACVFSLRELGVLSSFSMACACTDILCTFPALLYLHRACFAKALLDSPEDPLRSPYVASFLAAYRSAVSILQILKRKYAMDYRLVLRHWPTWAHALCASVSRRNLIF